MRRRLRSRLRGRANDIAFICGCGLIVGACALLSPVTGMLAGGALLIAAAVLRELGAKK